MGTEAYSIENYEKILKSSFRELSTNAVTLGLDAPEVLKAERTIVRCLISERKKVHEVMESNKKTIDKASEIIGILKMENSELTGTVEAYRAMLELSKPELLKVIGNARKDRDNAAESK